VWRKLVNVALALALLTSAPLALAAPPRIVALGDSLTAGFGLAPEQAFPVRLQAWLAAHGCDAVVVNAGVSGDTTAGGLQRLDWVLAEPADAVLVELGANDALRGLDPKQAYDNLDRILTRLEAKHLKVLLLGMLAPGNWGEDYVRDFDRIYPALAEKHGVALYPFFLEGVALDPKLNQPDGLHPNAAGVEAIVSRVGPAVLRLLGAAGSSG